MSALRALRASHVRAFASSHIMSRSLSSYIVTPRELSEALSKSDDGPSRIIPVSAEWYLPNDPRNGYAEFKKAHIPNARFFDLDAIKDHDSPYPHMVPTSETFTKAMSEMGIRRNDTIVVYDSPHVGIFSAPRAAWTFRLFGHPRVHLLNNFKLWIQEGFPVASGVEEKFASTEYPVTERDNEMVAGFDEMKGIAENGAMGIDVLDARPLGRFLGLDPEPRKGLSSGHSPGAVSVPFSDLVDQQTKALKSPLELRELFLQKGLDSSSMTEKRLMCGTGVTAVVIDAALELAGVPGKRKIYDGSWTEWAQRVDEKSGLIVKSATT